MFAGLKGSTFDLLKINGKNLADKSKRRNISIVLLAMITLQACFVTEHELGLVLGLVGAILGGAVVYVLPSLLNISVDRMKSNGLRKWGEKKDRILGVGGVALMGLGAWASILEAKQNSHH